MRQLSNINWRRGTLRFCLVLSVLWCAAVVFMGLNRPLAAPQRFLVKVSKFRATTSGGAKVSPTETWDYPADWGVARITADVKRRVADLDRKDREWAVSVPESRKAQCRAIPPTTPFADQPEDCVRMFFSRDNGAGWETDETGVGGPPISIWRAIEDIAPWAIAWSAAGLVMALGASVFWALAGFNLKSEVE
jgi:hypothetical protein